MDPTRRFSNRVADYVKYRPTYPQAIVTCLTEAGILTSGSIVADIGSGTGLLTQLFLDNGNAVFGVEPNREMRMAGEQQLRQYSRFVSIDGTAEATTLGDASVDVVAAGQAFHWFDRQRARGEFLRILRPSGWVVLIWNERLVDVTPFLVAYERLLQQFSIDYAAMDHRRITDDVIGAFFHPRPFTLKTFANRQVFDFEGLKGRLLSSSYAPPAGHPQHQPMLSALTSLFQAHQVSGAVTIEYETKVYAGRLGRAL